MSGIIYFLSILLLHMNRSTFIFLTLAGTASVVLPSSGCRHEPDPLAHPDFLSHVCDAATIARIGEAYRKQAPEEAQKDKLIGLLQAGVDPRRIRAEYAAGNTVILKGWVLSLTEARQCALYSLLPQ
jgi:hypothetical protein